MKEITSFTDFENQIKLVSGKPKVLEALWDGDTNGWKLFLTVYTEKIFSRKLFEHYIGWIHLGNDLRIFHGEVPPWPEAVMAEKIGKKAIERYGLEFYFPSPDMPDDDCPKYYQKHLAINCADCNKLILPDKSEYLPEDCCYNCHLIRERNDNIINEKEYNDGVNFYKVKDGLYSKLGYASDYKSFDIYKYTKDQFREQKITNQISVVKIVNDERLRYLRKSIYQQTLEAISKYESPNKERKGKWAKIYRVSFEDKLYELQPYLDDTHQMIFKFFEILELFDVVIEENYDLEFYIKDNFTIRDDAFLRFLIYDENKRASRNQFINKFGVLLKESEIDKTLTKLIGMNCIQRWKDTIEISELGEKIV